MDKKIYQIDNRRPSLLPKIGSAVVAMGSLATAAAVASPNLISFSQATTEAASATQDATATVTAEPVATDSVSTAEPTLPSQQVEGVQVVAEPVTQAQTLDQLPGAVVNPTSDQTPTATPTQTPIATQTPTPTLDPLADLTPIGAASVGNTSTATPVAGTPATSIGAGGTGGTTVGNISNPTQVASGSSYEDDRDDYDDHEERHDSRESHEEHDDD
jgi:hypothetical protein